MKENKRLKIFQVVLCVFSVMSLCMINVSAQETTLANKNENQIKEEIKTGIQVIDNQICMIMPDGSKYKGWFSTEGKKFYFDENGYMQTKECVIDGKLYQFLENGEFVTGWQNEKGNIYYRDERGCITTGLKTIGGKNYLFDPDGKLITNQTIGMYVADSSGVLTRVPCTLENLDIALDEILAETGKDIPKIGKYVNRKLKYRYIDKLSTREEMAVYALNNRRCSCYYYEALCGLLLERAGYEVITMNGDGRVYAEHYWSLVKTTKNGVEGWYHVDALHELYLLTDREMMATGQKWDHSKFPATP